MRSLILISFVDPILYIEFTKFFTSIIFSKNIFIFNQKPVIVNKIIVCTVEITINTRVNIIYTLQLFFIVLLTIFVLLSVLLSVLYQFYYQFYYHHAQYIVQQLNQLFYFCTYNLNNLSID